MLWRALLLLVPISLVLAAIDTVPRTLVFVAAILAIGGIWIWWFIFQLRRTALVPVNDPRLLEVRVHA